MQRIYFVNYTNYKSGIRATDIKMFYKLKDLKSFIIENNISGYVIRQYFKNYILTKVDFLGNFNGFEPSAQEHNNILKAVRFDEFLILDKDFKI